MDIFKVQVLGEKPTTIVFGDPDVKDQNQTQEEKGNRIWNSCECTGTGRAFTIGPLQNSFSDYVKNASLTYI